MKATHNDLCESIIIKCIKQHKNYISIMLNLKNKLRYNFRDNIILKYLTKFIVDMLDAGENTFIDNETINCQVFAQNFGNDYIQHVIKSFFISEIFNTLINKKYKHILRILQEERYIMNVIICKLYQIKDNEPITSNWKGFKYYFSKIVNMPYILFEQGIPMEHFYTLHNFLGNHSEFNALIDSSPLASHGLMYQGWIDIQQLVV